MLHAFHLFALPVQQGYTIFPTLLLLDILLYTLDRLTRISALLFCAAVQLALCVVWLQNLS